MSNQETEIGARRSASRRRRLTHAERRAQTRAALMEAAARVFVERGLQGTSVEAITEEAGYTRGAFYSNFDSKEELFAELLQERVYSLYRRMAERAGPERLSLRAAGERLAAIQADSDGRWMFRLWLELLAHAGRDEQFRKLAAGFWSGNRALVAHNVDAEYAAAGSEPPVAADHVATAMIALDIGLALQHYVDPDAVPLELYPELFEQLFEPLRPRGGRSGRRRGGARGGDG